LRQRNGLPTGATRADESGMAANSGTAARAAKTPTDPWPPPRVVAGAWSPPARRIASLLILLHVSAVFVAPFAFACATRSGSSPLADGLMRWYRPYVNLLYLNHGYAFFAPDPGASHLVRYRVEFADGRAPVEGTFPDLKTQRPRLLYHRHFMIADSLHNLYAPPDEPQGMPLNRELLRTLSESKRRELEAANRQQHQEQVRQWRHRRNQYEALRSSLERHLLAVHGGSQVTLTRVEHSPITPDEFELLGTLTAPHTYRDLPEGRPAPAVNRP
jgi:hypothetical protein